METLATSMHGRYPSANISPAEISDHHKTESLSIYAKVHKKVTPEKLKSHLHRLWNRTKNPFKGTLQVFTLEKQYFQLKFSNSVDYNTALENGPWLIDGHYIYLEPWVPNFKPSTTVITKIKVWIRLPELPTEYYDKIALQYIAMAVGNLIKIDPFTENKFNFKFARICVEIDLTQPLVSQVELNEGFLQPVEYEGLHGIQELARIITEKVSNIGFEERNGTSLASKSKQFRIDEHVKGFIQCTQELKFIGENLEIFDQRLPTVVTVESNNSDLYIRVNAKEDEITFIPSGIGDGDSSKFGPRKILIWNCCAAWDLVEKLCETYKLSILILSDNDVKNAIKTLGFCSSYCNDSVLILWNHDEVAIDITPNDSRSNSNSIYAAAKFINEEHDAIEDDWVLA